MDTSFIGKKTGKVTVSVERGPITNFANAIGDDDPIFRNLDAAKEAGYGAIPAPPTFGFVMQNWGAFEEVQEQNDSSIDSSAMAGAMKELMSEGGLMLHGEQEFTYNSPIVVGDVLVGETSIVDMYEKESKGRRMKFLVAETKYTRRDSREDVLTTRMNLICRL